ncbi:perlucin-like protein [Ylistrum balloti]|uniref:perlucin-like protein n=1 Tax=Ylistrum balloti TaxID=509963 RepID=UPI0029058FFE|nr:perlucin-like protein [Ylistrum balloti]
MAKNGHNLSLIFMSLCVIWQVQGQVLTAARREENARARREQQLLMRIRQEVSDMVQKVREETILPAIAMYSTQMYELSESVVNISRVFANLSAEVEELQENIKNGSLSPPCPDHSWVLHGRHCYFFSNSYANWQSAQSTCLSLHATLAKASTPALNDVLKREAKARGDTFWIGGHDRFEENTWEWIGDGSLITYTDWGPDQPNDVRAGQDCLELLMKFQFRWNDRECTESQRYICETPVSNRRN